MDIIVPHKIKKRELGGEISDEARKLFAKLKDRPEIAVGISSPALPAGADNAPQSLCHDRGRRAPIVVFLSPCLRG